MPAEGWTHTPVAHLIGTLYPAFLAPCLLFMLYGGHMHVTHLLSKLSERSALHPDCLDPLLVIE